MIVPPAALDPALVAALRGVRLVVFDFDGVFTDNFVYVSQDGIESVRCWRSDGLGLATLARLGIELAIVSTETNPVVAARSRKLGVRCVQGCEDKHQALVRLSDELSIPLGETAYVGNDINDASCLAAAGVPIVVADAHPDVVPYARYRTAIPGGRGAVREVCDLVARLRAPDRGGAGL